MRNLHLIKPGDVCAEVGVWKGEFSHYILQCKPSKLHLIDPWLHQDFPVDNPEDLRIYCCGQEEMDKIKEAKKVERAMVNLNRVYLGEAYHNGDEEYMQAFNAFMAVVRRIQDE